MRNRLQLNQSRPCPRRGHIPFFLSSIHECPLLRSWLRPGRKKCPTLRPGARHVQELEVSCLRPPDVLGPDPTADDDCQEEKGTDNAQCRGPCGEGCPLDINEGDNLWRLVNGVLGVLGLLAVHAALHPLELSQLCCVPFTFGAGTGNDDPFSFSWSLLEHLGVSLGVGRLLPFFRTWNLIHPTLILILTTPAFQSKRF